MTVSEQNILKKTTAWELYNKIESLYPKELENMKQKKYVALTDLINFLQQRRQDILDNEPYPDTELISDLIEEWK